MSSQTTLNLSLPSQLKKKAQVQAKNCNYSSTSDYLQSLIRADIERTEGKKNLAAFLRKGLDSGKGKEMNTSELDQWMTDIIKDSQ